MVRDELRKYYNATRVTAVIKPIFLSDFIFFRVQGKGVQLGRVAHAPYGGAMRPSDTVDVTEHEHTPQQGVQGFFGTFKPKKNPHFNQQARGSLQFVRHRDVARADVVVFNVQTFGTGESIRVSSSSLRELHDALPHDHPIPSRLPASHQSHEQEERSRRNQVPATRQPDGSSVEPIRPPVVKAGDSIEVYWTDEPIGWFGGVVTSSRKENGAWCSRVQYHSCAQWRSHHAWHRLDPLDEDHVTWRVARARDME